MARRISCGLLLNAISLTAVEQLLGDAKYTGTAFRERVCKQGGGIPAAIVIFAPTPIRRQVPKWHGQ